MQLQTASYAFLSYIHMPLSIYVNKSLSPTITVKTTLSVVKAGYSSAVQIAMYKQTCTLHVAMYKLHTYVHMGSHGINFKSRMAVKCCFI